MKRKVALLLTCALVLSLAGCGGEKNHTGTEGTEITSEGNSEPTMGNTEPGFGSEQEETETEEAHATSLKELFAEHGMKVGTCFNADWIDNKRMNNVTLAQFNSITMENEMKPEVILNQGKSVAAGELVVEFNQNMAKMMEFARENGFGVRGHTLIWHSQTPDWIFFEDFDTSKKQVSREVMLDRMEKYIKQVFDKLTDAGYTDLIYAYDVANECWMEDGSMRESYWKSTIGDDYLWYAFNR